MKEILIIAAENSAENYGALIVDTFKKNNTPCHFFGTGGDKLQAAGAELLIHNKELSVVGIIEVVSSLLKLKKIMSLLVSTAIRRKASAALLIDYPDFNIRLAKKLNKAGIPVYYFISPTVWAWRYSRVHLLKKYVSHMFIIFPFEIPIFDKEQIPYTYTGHPLLPLIKINENRYDFRKRMEISDSEKLVALLPGSRQSEVHFLLPAMLQTMSILKKELPLSIILLKADNIDLHIIENYLKDIPFQVRVIPQSLGYDLIAASDGILTTCGTSNLEMAMIGTPFVSVYRVNRLSYLLGKRFVKINRYSIVNILAGKEVVKELIQKTFTVPNMVAEMRRILTDTQIRETMIQEFQRIREMLAQNTNAPEIIYEKISKDLNLNE